MGLRPDGEKPATVLWLVYTLGWLPALVCAYALRASAPGLPGAAVLNGAGQQGVAAGLALGISLAILGVAYLAAIRHPPSARVLLLSVTGSTLAVLAMPLLFSADVYAYAYYGDLALQGRNPYGHGPAPANDALAAAAVAAWNGRVPPRCVYGPVAVAIAGLADFGGYAFAELRMASAVLAGTAQRVGAQIFMQRLAAVGAYAAYIAGVLRIVRDPRSRAMLILNPVVIWSVAEGHNDAAMVACVAVGFSAARGRAAFFALGALVKAPALLAFARLERGRAAVLALCLVVAGYLPLALAIAGTLGSGRVSASAAAWQSPLGLVAAWAGRLPAAGAALILLGLAGLTVRRLPPADRIPAFAVAAWFGLPNAYPWYSLWIVPLAARTPPSTWTRALLIAAMVSPARAITDAVFRAPESIDATASFHTAMIALEYLPPLCFLAWAALRRRAAVALTVVAVMLTVAPPAIARAETNAPSLAPATPGPLIAPATPTAASPAATPTGTAPAPAPQAAPPTPPEPSPTPTPPTPPTAAPAPTSSAAPQPPLATAAPPLTTGAPAPPPPATIAPALPQTVPPAVAAPSPTANPFSYIINPPPVPTTTPDGPHIIQVALNDRRIHAGGPLLVRVFTSPNVVGVEARALGRFIPIPESSPGLFALAYTMPSGVPFWLLNKNYDIVIAAATADGRQTSVSFQMLFMR